MKVPVYDILNCGPRHRFVANGKLVHNSENLNMQNLPRGGTLKHAIIAPEGYVCVDSDSSQIEARTLAWLAGQNDLVEAFEKGEDVYCDMASAIYGRVITKADKEPRQVGKVVILGAGYGIGAAKLQTYLKLQAKVSLPVEECQHIVRTYRDKYPMIAGLWKTADRILPAIAADQYAEFGRDNLLKVEGRKGIRLPNGLYLKYPNLRKVQSEDGTTEWVYDTRKGKAITSKKIYGAYVVENVCQGLARIVIGEQMLRIAKKYKVTMTVHDSIGCIAPEEEAARAQEYVEMCMRIRPAWAPELPLNCEAGYGRSYGDC